MRWHRLLIRAVALLIAAPSAVANEAAVRQRLLELGFHDHVAQALASAPADWHRELLAEAARGVVAEGSAYRPVKVYRGVQVPIEQYDSIRGRGSIMVADGVRWVTELPETARFFAGVVARRPRLNTGVVLELQVPRALLKPGGSSFAAGLPLAHSPDEALFASRIGLGHFRLERSGRELGLAHPELTAGAPPELTWFSPSAILEMGQIRLPSWARSSCASGLSGLGSSGLPSTNPLF